jgi:2-keto-4-pentenoate hydratase/2-oxohepta-3-ene-1,7-dioic acid hydratase in catechol pathway
MRLLSFSVPTPPAEPPGVPHAGLVVDDEIVDLSDPSSGLPADLAELLSLGPDALDRARQAPSGQAARYPIDSVRRLAPIPHPPAILAIGMNYRAHVAEMGREPPEYQ